MPCRGALLQALLLEFSIAAFSAVRSFFVLGHEYARPALGADFFANKLSAINLVVYALSLLGLFFYCARFSFLFSHFSSNSQKSFLCRLCRRHFLFCLLLFRPSKVSFNHWLCLKPSQFLLAFVNPCLARNLRCSVSCL